VPPECSETSVSHFEMHQNRFRLGLRPRPRWGSSQRSPRPLFEIAEGEGREGKGKEGREGKGEIGPPDFLNVDMPMAIPTSNDRKKFIVIASRVFSAEYSDVAAFVFSSFTFLISYTARTRWPIWTLHGQRRIQGDASLPAREIFIGWCHGPRVYAMPPRSTDDND
jgi:hypothetical protein